MELFKNFNIDFIGKRKIFYSISIFFIVLGLGALIKNRGPVLGIEFTGGTMLQAKFNDLPPIDQIREVMSKGPWEGYSIQTQPNAQSVLIRVKSGEKSKEDIAGELMAALKSAFPGNVHDVPERIEFIGPAIGNKLILDAFKAIVFSLIAIVVYIGWRFKNWIWGAVGVLALAHDVFITFGLLVLLQKEISLVVVAALLTLAGYSINDTIVIFDRAREKFREAGRVDLKELYNRSINDTLGRTVNTAFAALLAALSLVIWGGEVIRDFSLTMTFGIVIGSYSTIAVAISLIYQLETRAKRRAR